MFPPFKLYYAVYKHLLMIYKFYSPMHLVIIYQSIVIKYSEIYNFPSPEYF